jgi:hypothetical protein
MKTTITAILLGILLAGSLNAGHKGCRNNSGTCKCKCNYTTTIDSTGTYLVDLSKGPLWINFNPENSGTYQFRVYKKSIAMSLIQCGKSGYVPAVHKKDSCSNSLVAELCRKATYRFYLCKARRSDDTVILQISRNSGCSRIRRISPFNSRKSLFDRNRSCSITNRWTGSSCSRTKYRYKGNEFYMRNSHKGRYFSTSDRRKKCLSTNGFSLSFRF